MKEHHLQLKLTSHTSVDRITLQLSSITLTQPDQPGTYRGTVWWPSKTKFLKRSENAAQLLSSQDWTTVMGLQLNILLQICVPSWTQQWIPPPTVTCRQSKDFLWCVWWFLDFSSDNKTRANKMWVLDHMSGVWDFGDANALKIFEHELDNHSKLNIHSSWPLWTTCTIHDYRVVYI